MPTSAPAPSRSLLRRAGALVPPALVALAVGAGAALVYALTWPDGRAFVLAIDHADRFQQDFLAYYHPASAGVLRGGSPPGGYYYPAFFALLLAPLGLAPAATAAHAWLGLQGLAWLAYVLVLARGLCGWRVVGTAAVALLAATSYPVLHNLKWGQVSVLLALACFGAAAAALRGRARLAGALLGVAAAIKYYPAGFALWFVLRRDWRALGAFAATVLLAGAAVPALCLGFDGWLAFDGEIARRAGAADWVVDDPNSQYVANVARRWWLLATGAAPAAAAMTALRLAGLAVAAAIAWLAHVRVRAGQPALAFAALATALPFVVTTSWPHYFVVLVGAQALAFAAAATTARPDAVRAAVGLSVALASMGAFALAPTWAHFNGYGLPFVANLAALAAVALARPAKPIADGGNAA